MFSAKQYIRKIFATWVCVCLVCASILPCVAIACEGETTLAFEAEGVFKVSIAKGFSVNVKNAGPVAAKELFVPLVGKFEDAGSTCNELAELKVGAKCSVKLKCAVLGAKGEVRVEGKNFAPLKEELECVP